jgi:hypothetical protein
LLQKHCDSYVKLTLITASQEINKNKKKNVGQSVLFAVFEEELSVYEGKLPK